MAVVYRYLGGDVQTRQSCPQMRVTLTNDVLLPLHSAVDHTATWLQKRCIHKMQWDHWSCIIHYQWAALSAWCWWSDNLHNSSWHYLGFCQAETTCLSDQHEICAMWSQISLRLVQVFRIYAFKTFMFKIFKHFCPKLIKLTPDPDDTLLLTSMGYIYDLLPNFVTFL